MRHRAPRPLIDFLSDRPARALASLLALMVLGGGGYALLAAGTGVHTTPQAEPPTEATSTSAVPSTDPSGSTTPSSTAPTAVPTRSPATGPQSGTTSAPGSTGTAPSTPERSGVLDPLRSGAGTTERRVTATASSSPGDDATAPVREETRELPCPTSRCSPPSPRSTHAPETVLPSPRGSG